VASLATRERYVARAVRWPPSTGAGHSATQRGTSVTSIGRTRWPAALFLLAALAAFVVYMVARQRPAADLPEVPCRERTIAVQLSSSDRSPARRTQVIDLLETAAVSAAVCESPLAAYGVGGGGTVVPLVTSDDLAEFVPAGPRRVRATRFRAEQQAQVRDLVARRLDDALRTSDGATTTVVALYHTVAEHSSTDTDVILVTDGVNHDADLDLNRALVPGEGRDLATTVDVPSIGNQATTVVGLGQVDGATPAPGTTWPDEIRSFNEALCLRSGARVCRLFSAATTDEVLRAQEESAP
jgi:hypothetical protein